METRVVSRWDVHKYAREAYNLGVKFIGGCCGFEAYHIRAISEELSKERGGYKPPASSKSDYWGVSLQKKSMEVLRKRYGCISITFFKLKKIF